MIAQNQSLDLVSIILLSLSVPNTSSSSQVLQVQIPYLSQCAIRLTELEWKKSCRIRAKSGDSFNFCFKILKETKLEQVYERTVPEPSPPGEDSPRVALADYDHEVLTLKISYVCKNESTCSKSAYLTVWTQQSWRKISRSSAQLHQAVIHQIEWGHSRWRAEECMWQQLLSSQNFTQESGIQHSCGHMPDWFWMNEIFTSFERRPEKPDDAK